MGVIRSKRCVKCGEPATTRFSPDLDIDGIYACDEHKEKIGLYLLIASIENDYKIFKNYINGSTRKTNRKAKT